MRILVTGNLGFIGSLAVEMLKEQGYNVTGLDIGYYDGCDFGHMVIPDSQLRKDIRTVTMDDLEGIDAVLHFAALSNDPMGELNPQLTELINYKASVRLAELAKQSGIDRFIFSSSCSLYGKANGDEAKTEEDEMNPLTVYAKSKVMTEIAVSKLADETFCPVFMRNATAYGVSPRLRLDLVLNNLTGVAWTSKEIRIMSDGTPWRPIIHARDIVRAYIHILEAPRDAVYNQTFNVGADQENYQVSQIADLVGDAVKGCSVVYTNEHGADSRSYRVSFKKIHQALPSFKLEWTAQKGIEELLGSFRKKEFDYASFTSRYYTRLKQIEFLLQMNRVDQNLNWIG